MASTVIPWKSTFLKHIGLLGGATPQFTLATVAGRTPRCRILLFRGFYGELEPTQYNKAPLNTPGSGTSDLLSYTTDVRMYKVRQLEAENTVEAVFWVSVNDPENPNKGYQWRIRGSSRVLPREADEETKKYIAEHLHRTDFDINKEATAHFGNVSPVIQKSFKSPMPGTPKEKGNTNPELGLRKELEGLHDTVARGNFRVAVIEPQRVELVDLTLSPAEKWVWVKTGSDEEKEEDLGAYGEVVGDWRKVEMFP